MTTATRLIGKTNTLFCINQQINTDDHVESHKNHCAALVLVQRRARWIDSCSCNIIQDLLRYSHECNHLIIRNPTPRPLPLRLRTENWCDGLFSQQSRRTLCRRTGLIWMNTRLNQQNKLRMVFIIEENKKTNRNNDKRIQAKQWKEYK